MSEYRAVANPPNWWCAVIPNGCAGCGYEDYGKCCGDHAAEIVTKQTVQNWLQRAYEHAQTDEVRRVVLAIATDVPRFEQEAQP